VEKANILSLRKQIIKHEGQLKTAYRSFINDQGFCSKNISDYWSFDISDYIIVMHSYYAMAQVASYLGLSQIFLVGFDPKKYDTNHPLDIEISNYNNDKIGFILDSLATDSPLYHIFHGLKHFAATRGYVINKNLSHFTDQYDTRRYSYILIEEMINSHKLASIMFDYLGINAYVVGSQYLPYQHVHPSEFESVVGSL